MTQQERRNYLIHTLLQENPAYRDLAIPSEESDANDLLRSLMNVRPPRPISSEFLRVQDAFLTAERDRRGVVHSDELPPVAAHSPLVLWQGDITTLQADAIVNAANAAMLGCFHSLHDCIDNIVHFRSGIQLRLLCHQIMQQQGHDEPTGSAKITPAFNLPSRYILHTVGPIVTGRVTSKDRQLLASCYRSCLELAVANDCHSLAFCCISTGEFHFPNRPAAEIAIQTVQSFLQETRAHLRVIFNVFKEQDLRIYQHLLGVKE